MGVYAYSTKCKDFRKNAISPQKFPQKFPQFKIKYYLCSRLKNKSYGYYY